MGVKYIFAEQDAPPTVGSRRDAERRQPITGIVGVEPEPGRRGKLVPGLVRDRVSPVPFWRVLEEDENVSSLTVKLVKPLGRRFDLDLRYSGYLGFLPKNDFFFMRHVVSFGVAVNY